MLAKSRTSVRPILLVLLTVALATALVLTFWYNGLLVYPPLQWRNTLALAVAVCIPSAVFMIIGCALFK